MIEARRVAQTSRSVSVLHMHAFTCKTHVLCKGHRKGTNAVQGVSFQPICVWGFSICSRRNLSDLSVCIHTLIVSLHNPPRQRGVIRCNDRPRRATDRDSAMRSGPPSPSRRLGNAAQPSESVKCDVGVCSSTTIRGPRPHGGPSHRTVRRRFESGAARSAVRACSTAIEQESPSSPFLRSSAYNRGSLEPNRP